jgi:predicted negative regulator of RcsB-dependent stress response
MKRTERHHLKEDPLAVRLRVMLDSTRGGRSAALVAAVVGGLLVGGAIFGWQQWRTTRAGELLASAMAIVDAPVVPADAGETPAGAYPSEAAKLETAVPRLLAAADAYPGLPQGIAARYQAAVALGTLGRTAEAGAQFSQLMEIAGDGIYGRMARLGRAETHLQAGEYADAIALLEAETRTAGAEFPVDAVLMRLGQSYQLADQPAEATLAFQRLVDEFPASGYRFDAERELDGLVAGR